MKYLIEFDYDYYFHPYDSTKDLAPNYSRMITLSSQSFFCYD